MARITYSRSVCSASTNIHKSESPYRDLVQRNRRRGRTEAEYELIDTGVLNQDRYFDVFVEYAKETPTDILIQISVCNRGPDAAPAELGDYFLYCEGRPSLLFTENETNNQLRHAQRGALCEGRNQRFRRRGQAGSSWVNIRTRSGAILGWFSIDGVASSP
jgi:hypothetical protein